MDKHLFKKKMQDLADFYPNWRLDITSPQVMKKWYKKFKEEDPQLFSHAVDEYIENESYPPNVAGIKKYIPYWPQDTITKKGVEKFIERNFG
ncbi:MAG: hypothetical protein ACOCRO_00565 [Halanaerobiales bacterium]